MAKQAQRVPAHLIGESVDGFDKLAFKKDAVAKVEPPISFRSTTFTVRCNVKIGAFTYFQSGSLQSCKSIGRYCSIGGEVRVGDIEHPTNWLSTSPFQYNAAHFGWGPGANDYEPLKGQRKTFRKKPVVIGNDVWIGARSMLMGGIKIGDGAVVAGGSVVTKDVAPYSIVGGVPARHIRYRFDEETINELGDLRWWRFSPNDLAGVPFDDIQAAIVEIRRRIDGGMRPYVVDRIELTKQPNDLRSRGRRAISRLLNRSPRLTHHRKHHGVADGDRPRRQHRESTAEGDSTTRAPIVGQCPKWLVTAFGSGGLVQRRDDTADRELGKTEFDAADKHRFGAVLGMGFFPTVDDDVGAKTIHRHRVGTVCHDALIEEHQGTAAGDEQRAAVGIAGGAGSLPARDAFVFGRHPHQAARAAQHLAQPCCDAIALIDAREGVFEKSDGSTWWAQVHVNRDAFVPRRAELKATAIAGDPGHDGRQRRRIALAAKHIVSIDDHEATVIR